MAKPFSDIVVVIPGLIGSVLSKDGKALWGTSPGALWRVVAGGALTQLGSTTVEATGSSLRLSAGQDLTLGNVV
ncbi:MAG: hypothetical protein JZU55_03200, partial [Afipia sp.]|nr:hypothetical protein [Afipia sp.]